MSPTAIRIDTLLREGWWTLQELTALTRMQDDAASRTIVRLSADRLIFRRRRVRSGVSGTVPYEYRILPQAVCVAVIDQAVP